MRLLVPDGNPPPPAIYDSHPGDDLVPAPPQGTQEAHGIRGIQRLPQKHAVQNHDGIRGENEGRGMGARHCLSFAQGQGTGCLDVVTMLREGLGNIAYDDGKAYAEHGKELAPPG